MGRSFSVKSFGCRAAQSDGAAIAADLVARGLQLSGDHSDADVVVINTCTVTSAADRDARQSIRRVHRENPDAEILVTGCYAQRRPEVLAALEGVKWVVGNSHKEDVGQIVAPGLVQIGGIDRHSLTYHGEIEADGILVGEMPRDLAGLSTPSRHPLGLSRPNVKVQDGCDNRCSFCIIPSVRGGSRSARSETVVREVRALQSDYPEVVLTGINLGRWGRDLEGRPRLADLIEILLSETSVRRIRLSSVEPMDWGGRLIELMASSPRIAKHVHMPLQSGSDSILRRMRRRYRTRHYESRVLLARAAMPTAAIGADVMVGFPGEGEAEFEETVAFVDRLPFTYLHVFSYSSREGTRAAQLGDHVSRVVKRRRNRILRELVAAKNAAFRQGFVGTRLSIVTIGASPNGSRADSDNILIVDLPGATLRPRRLLEARIDDVVGNRTIGHHSPPEPAHGTR